MREQAREHPEQAGRERSTSAGPHYGLRALGETVDAVARPMLGRRGFAGSRVVAEWASIVGEHLAARSLPERVTRPADGRGGGTLHVRVASGALAVELQHLEPLIVERINTYFGYLAVARLKLVHGPIPERRVERCACAHPYARRRGGGRGIGGGNRRSGTAAGSPRSRKNPVRANLRA